MTANPKRKNTLSTFPSRRSFLKSATIAGAAISLPAQVRWDLWQGVAPERAYKVGMYHPFNWRGWQAYGTGQLGDFGCHILDPVFKALNLRSPTRLTVEAPTLLPESWTDRATVHYEFPGTLGTIGIRFPEQELAWDAKALKITNHAKAQEWVTKPYRKGWEPTWI